MIGGMSMERDLPAELRALSHEFAHGHDLLLEAADEIERLTAALAAKGETPP